MTVMSLTIAHSVFQCFCLIDVYDTVCYNLQNLVFSKLIIMMNIINFVLQSKFNMFLFFVRMCILYFEESQNSDIVLYIP